MAHKFTDWTQLGGPPLTTDDLRHDYAGIYEAIAAIYGDGGTTPMILAGSFSGGGWLVINKEIVPMAATGSLPLLPTGWDRYIVVNQSATTVLYQDGTSKNTATVTKLASMVSADTATPPAGGVLASSFVPWTKIFGEKALGTEQSLTGSATQYDYTWYYKKNILTNTLRLRGTITVKIATSTTPTAFSLGILPEGFRPANAVPIIAQYRYHLSTLKDSTSSDFIDVLNGEVQTDGRISFVLRKPDSSVTSYTVSLNVSIPLD